MATEVRLPQFGMGMQEGKLLRWFKHEGEPVEEGEPLCEVETEKATVEVPSPQSGLLTRIMVEVDRTVPVLEVLALIESADDRLSSAPPHPPDALAQAAAAGPARQSHSSSGQAGVSVPAASLAGAATLGDMGSRGVQVTPLARRVAKDLGIDLNEVKGTGPGGRITDTDVRRTVASRRQSRVDEFPSPLSGPKVIDEQAATQVEPRARRLAIQHGIELSAVAGSGPGGRITEGDVQRMVNARQHREPEPPPLPSLVLKNDGGEAQESQPQVIRLSGMRGVIARRMLESIQTSAQLTLMSEADVSALVKRRESLAEQFDITYTDLLIKAAALALRKHPRLNATVTSQEIRVLPDIHIGMAVALDEGLVVPVVRNADRKPLRTIAGETAEFIQRARGGKLMMAEITGGTFTVTNLGSLGIDAFTPILNPPEAAILGIGRIIERPTRRESDLLWRHMMALSLTIDHRVVDGAPAAAFLQTLRELLERPELLD